MENNPQKEKQAPMRKEGETLKEKIHRHLHDKNDIITNEDIRDVKVGKDTIPDLKKESEKLTDEIPDNKVVTPWDILDEE